VDKKKNGLKKNLILIVAIMALTALVCYGLIIISYVMRPISNSRENFCGFYAEDDDSLDAVLIGASSCYYAWQPLRGYNEYGFTSFNLGTDALQPQSIVYEVKEVMKTQSPSLIMIDLRPFQYGKLIGNVENVANMERVAPFRNVCDNMKYSINRYDLISNGAPDSEPEWTYQIDLSKYHTLISELFSVENWKYAFNSYPLTSKGFWYHAECRDVEITERTNMGAKTPLDSEIEEILRNLLQTVKDEYPDLKVIFLVMPHGGYAVEEGTFNSLYEIINVYGYDYFNGMDYLNEMGIDPLTDFRDEDHLNLSGANKLSTFLGNYLSEKYNLPDRRSDVGFSSWQDCYNEWIEEIDNVNIVKKEYDVG